uniref:NAD(P)-binding domain-containing protein n=1 Tax=Zooxanthella nutricula TaxID=1333877 RepID=A0A6U6XEC1_9DINO|mmetsp:Transcript_98124/g.300031  ORF Transcript_98124/g.300031 Transcript_98124/m.300031 type:complete len:254 (+) Transcript_98124:135-896(+)
MAAPGSALVFGGRGFVGAAICRELARRGIPVQSLSRSDKAGSGGDLGPGVEHKAGVDALRAETFRALLPGARAVVVSIGEAPWTERTGGSKERAVQMNGLSNVNILRAAAEAKVPRVVLVNATMPQWGLLAGYREGKEMAEAEAKRFLDTSGLDAGSCTVLVMKPSVISGTKYWGSVPLPFGVAMEPMRLVMRCFAGPCAWLEGKAPGLFGGVLRPAVRVEELAAAAADAIAGEGRGHRTLETGELVGYPVVS